MLRHLEDSARRQGLIDRIRPLRVDLDAGWPSTEAVDLVWASSSMHHMADPDRVLRDIHTVLHPGGLLAMVEMESMPRFLPDDPGIGRAGLEARCNAAMEAARNEHLPHIGSDWKTRLTAAGFTIREERTLEVSLTAPLSAAAIRYATLTLQHFRTGLAGLLDAADLAALDELLADDGLGTRPDLIVRSSRLVWLAVPS